MNAGGDGGNIHHIQPRIGRGFQQNHRGPGEIRRFETVSYTHLDVYKRQLIDCTPFKTSKSGVLFPPDQPLPAALVERIVRARQAELNRR